MIIECRIYYNAFSVHDTVLFLVEVLRLFCKLKDLVVLILILLRILLWLDLVFLLEPGIGGDVAHYALRPDLLTI